MTEELNMTKELFEWLEFRFYHDNHVKYRKYFKEWIANITPNQIEGFYKQMITKLWEWEKLLMKDLAKAFKKEMEE